MSTTTRFNTDPLKNSKNFISKNIEIDRSKDDLLTDFGKKVLKDRYLLPHEGYQDLFARVASYYSDDDHHASNLYKYISNLWFMPATPILSNGGTNRGLPISCFLNETDDSLEGISDLWTENIWLASRGGGIGSYWGNVRSINETIAGNGKSSGIIPFLKVQDSMTLAISQGSLRRGSAAVYLPINHPEIEEFIDIRRATGGDVNRKALNLHHGVCVTDDFMHAVEQDEKWNLVSPSDHKTIISTVKARDLWVKLLTTRIETGEPYILFIDAVNKSVPEHHKQLGLTVKTSNLCNEITLPTGKDHLGNRRTAVCCLSSLNLEYYQEWKNNENFIPDVMKFLDNVLQDFINKAPDTMSCAKYSAMRERSVGLGVMGFHSFLQSKLVPIESVTAKSWNKQIFQHISSEVDKASQKLAKERGACEDAKEVGFQERFSNKTAIAPTASISVICGNSSPGIEPHAANSFVQKTLTGSFVVENKYLQKLLHSKGFDTDAVWSSIATREGSVQHLSCLTDLEKEVFKTASEINQQWLVDLASDRVPYISQSQSLNLFFPGDVNKSYLHKVHFTAWEKGLKGLYYVRSTSIQRAEKVSHEVKSFELELAPGAPNVGKDIINSGKVTEVDDGDECLACQ